MKKLILLIAISSGAITAAYAQSYSSNNYANQHHSSGNTGIYNSPGYYPQNNSYYGNGTYDRQYNNQRNGYYNQNSRYYRKMNRGYGRQFPARQRSIFNTIIGEKRRGH